MMEIIFLNGEIISSQIYLNIFYLLAFISSLIIYISTLKISVNFFIYICFVVLAIGTKINC